MIGDSGAATVGGGVEHFLDPRPAHTAARGHITATNVAIITAVRIWIRYVRKAIIVPICISPAPTRAPPNHTAATLDTFSTSITLGNMNAWRRPALQRGVGEVGVGHAEALSLLRFTHERADDAHALDLFPKDLVRPVDAGLHVLELRNQPDDDETDAEHERRNGDDEDQRERAILTDRQDQATDDHDRRGDEERAHHHDQHLHLLDVVGDAGDERRGTERVDVGGGERGDATEQRAAHVAAEAHRGARTEVDRDHREHHLHERDRRAARRPCARCNPCRAG